MKAPSPFLLLMLMSGCTAPEPVKITTVVGPSSAAQAGAREDGALKVFSRREMKGDADGPVELPHSDYEVCTPAGNRVQVVRNSTEQNVLLPAIVPLHPGRYLIKARARNSGMVEVPVLIKSGRITVLHLDRGGTSQHLTADAGENVVRLPDGSPIGWRATNP
ncbi:MAG: hypothetical protein K1X78_16135 [Verrucomicrobiaceae bacterium]|nr:hypothetical protein [Verrucomicrobiaceae bacterium]